MIAIGAGLTLWLVAAIATSLYRAEAESDHFAASEPAPASDYTSEGPAPTVVIAVSFDEEGATTPQSAEVGGIQVAPLRPDIMGEAGVGPEPSLITVEPTPSPTPISGLN